MRDLEVITGAIVEASVQLHRDLGPGLMGSVYEVILARMLEQQGFRVERQRIFRFEYQGMVFEKGFRIDLLVEDRVIVEVKSVEQLARQHPKQLLTYLKLSGRNVGLLINFGAPVLREGLRRIVNDYQPSSSPRLRVNQKAGRSRKQTDRGLTVIRASVCLALRESHAETRRRGELQQTDRISTGERTPCIGLRWLARHEKDCTHVRPVPPRLRVNSSFGAVSSAGTAIPNR